MASPLAKPVPPDFDPATPITVSMTKHGVSKSTIGKWRREAGYKGRPGALEPWTDLEDQQLKANFNSLTYPQIADLIGRSAAAVKSRAILLGLRKAAAQFQRDTRTKFEGQRAKGRADLAAEYVRCHDRVAIFRCDAAGAPKPKGDHWKYGFGSLILTDDEMIAKAERKGWAPDAWKELKAA